MLPGASNASKVRLLADGLDALDWVDVAKLLPRILRAPSRLFGSLVVMTPREELIERAGRALLLAARKPARVVLFGSSARGDEAPDSDLDFLVIESDVEDRASESIRLRRALGDIGVPVDVVVLDEGLASRRAKVPGTMVHHALREGRVVAES